MKTLRAACLSLLLSACALSCLAQNITDGMPKGSDITSRIVAAFAQSAVNHQTVHIGDGDWTYTQPVTQNGFAVRGESENTHLSFTGDPAQAVAAYTITDAGAIDGRIPTLRDLTLTGPWRGKIGDAAPGLLGIDCLCAARIDGVFVGNFKAGIVDDSYSGHVYLTACKSGNNVYGLYTRNRNGDCRVVNCDLTGNTLASCGMTPTGGLQSGSMSGTHTGFSPYIFYKEAGQPSDGIGTTFLGDFTIQDSPAEAVGNAYAWSDFSYQQGGPRDEVRNLSIVRPGFTRNAAYADPKRPQGTFHGDYMRGVIQITQGDNPIAPAPGGRLFEFVLPFPGSVIIDGQAVPQSGFDTLRTFLPQPQPAQPPANG